jgi:hypothetical protein
MVSRRMAMDWAVMVNVRDQITAEWRRRSLNSR